MKYAIVVTLLCLFAVNVASQPNQAPAKREKSTEPKSPPSLPPPNNSITTADAEHPKEDAPKWYASLERPDWWLVLIAAITGFAIFYQAREMKDATEVMRGQLKAMQDQLGQMDSSGKQTGELIKQAEKQAKELHDIAEIAVASAQAAKDTIILTHRPKLIIRDVVVPWRALTSRGTCVRNLNANHFDDWQLGGAFYIVNVGNQTATVVSLEQFLSFDEMLPLERPYESGVRKTVVIKLKPGQSQKIPFHPIAIGEPDTRTLTLGVPMMVIGRIVYEDDLGNSRETGFARKFDMRRSRFTPIDDPDYEYAD